MLCLISSDYQLTWLTVLPSPLAVTSALFRGPEASATFYLEINNDFNERRGRGGGGESFV